MTSAMWQTAHSNQPLLFAIRGMCITQGWRSLCRPQGQQLLHGPIGLLCASKVGKPHHHPLCCAGFMYQLLRACNASPLAWATSTSC